MITRDTAFELKHFRLELTIKPVDTYLFKVNNRNTRTTSEIYSKLTIKTPERHHRRRYSVFVVNFGQIIHIVLVILLLTLNK